jgi:hypothetical protein
MKHILISCDSCNKVVPQQGTKDWWGHKKSGIQVIFAPITKRNREEFTTGHACSEVCLAACLRAYAETMDRKEVPVATGVSYINFPDMMRFGWEGMQPRKYESDETDD